jgi:pimeloyl-ACP methyl ester carboxylesterase
MSRLAVTTACFASSAVAVDQMAGSGRISEVVAVGEPGVALLTSAELAAISAPTTFILGSDDPYLSVEHARPSVGQIPAARPDGVGLRR